MKRQQIRLLFFAAFIIASRVDAGDSARPLGIEDAFTSQEMLKISLESRSIARRSAFKAKHTMLHSQIREEQGFFDACFAASTRLLIARSKQKMASEHIFIYYNDVFDPGYTNSPLYLDHLWLQRFYDYQPDSASEESVGQPDSLHPDCVCLDNQKGYAASGVLIASQLVVTAAHCYELGFTNHVLIGTNVDGPGQNIYQVTNSVVYPGFDTNTCSNDISLLILQSPVTNVPYFKIALPSMIANVAYASIVGFGATNSYGKAGFGTRRCAYPIILGDPSLPNYKAFPASEMVGGMLLFDLSQMGLTTCQGDSGGPIYLNANGVDCIAGVTSRGVVIANDSDIHCGMGSIFVRLDVYLDWIRGVARSNSIEFDQ
jgi:hypothetical protein